MKRMDWRGALVIAAALMMGGQAMAQRQPAAPTRPALAADQLKGAPAVGVQELSRNTGFAVVTAIACDIRSVDWGMRARRELQIEAVTLAERLGMKDDDGAMLPTVHEWYVAAFNEGIHKASAMPAGEQRRFCAKKPNIDLQMADFLAHRATLPTDWSGVKAKP